MLCRVEIGTVKKRSETREDFASTKNTANGAAEWELGKES